MNSPRLQPRLTFFAEILVIVVVYFLTAQFEFLFSFPPGNVTHLWLPSGLALAGTMLFGYRAGVGIWLGSFVANVWQAGGGAWTSDPTALIVSAAIATGSTLQALAAWRILLRWFAPLQREIEIAAAPIRKFIAAAALACLVAATVGVTALFLSGQVAPSAIPFTWGVWWLGDWLGMLAGAPVFYIAGLFLLRRPGPNADPILAASFGMVVSMALFALSWSQETRALKAEFQVQADDAQSALMRTADYVIRDLNALQDLYAASDFVTRSEFQIVTQEHLFGKYATPGLQGLSWNPYVKQADRAAFEAAIQQEGISDFHFQERNAEGQLIPAAERADYVVVGYIEPLAANKTALGFDVSSNPSRREALERSRDTGHEAMTAPITLVQDTGKHIGFLIFAPVYQNGAPVTTIEERRANLRGYVVSVIRVDRLVEASRAALPIAGRDIYLFDMDMPAGQQLLVFNPSRARTEPAPPVDPALNPAALQSDFYYAQTMEVAGRHWQVVIKPAPGILEAKRSWTPWMVLTFSLLITASNSAYFLNRLTAERQRQDLVESMPDGVVATNAEGRIVLVNAQAEQLFGYTRAELLGQPVEMLIPAQSCSLHVENRRKYLEHPGTLSMNSRNNIYAMRKDGSQFPADIGLNTVTNQNRLMVIAVVRDITTRKRLEEVVRKSQEELLRKSYENLKRVLDDSADAIIITDEQSFVKFSNQSARALFGDRIAEGEEIGTLLNVDKTGELDILKSDGTRRIAEARSGQTDWFGNEARIVVFRDVTDRRQLAEFWRSASFRDELTGLYNRRGFVTLARQQLELARGNHNSATLLFGDLDGLKGINDTYGHQSGDQALVAVATIFKATFRDVDIIARIGGDEFAILLINIKTDEFTRLQGRLQERIQAFNAKETQPFTLSISTGAVFSEPSSSLTLEELLLQADALQYEKKRKRN